MKNHFPRCLGSQERAISKLVREGGETGLDKRYSHPSAGVPAIKR